MGLGFPGTEKYARQIDAHSVDVAEWILNELYHG